MKNIVLLITILFAISVSAQESKLHWLTDFEMAKKISKDTEKPILMYFTGSDWCAPCIILNEDFFSTPKFEKLAEKLVILKVDIPRKLDVISEDQLKANKKLLAKYNPEKGFPTIVALDYNGKILGNQSSYSASLRDPSRYFSFANMIIDNYYR